MKPQLTYYNIGIGAVAFSTTRHGGYSQGSYEAFNVNLYCGDDPVAITRNRQSLCALLQVDERRLLMPHQVHGTTIRRVTANFLQLPLEQQRQELEGVDALMTDVTDVCIGVSTADCVPIILYDSLHRAACVVHAGWRGTLARITEKALAAMVSAYHSCPADMQAVIGPSISPDSFEVGDEVYQQFAEAGFPMQAVSRRMPAMNGEPLEKWHIDLWACNRLQLQGIPSDRIQVTGICTYQHSADYFSARRLGVQSGRILTGVVLR